MKILEIFNEALEGKCGKIPSYNTVENWMKKLGLSTYENDSKPTDKKFACIIDESIMVNREKLLLILGIPANHLGRPIKHEDVTVIGMKSSGGFKGDDIKQEIENPLKELGLSLNISSATKLIILQMELSNQVCCTISISVMPWAHALSMLMANNLIL